MRREHVDVHTVERWLNERSGLLGLSGRSNDVRELTAAERDDRQAALALDLFCYRVRKYVGAYLAVLGGADAVVFGGGIGEHSAALRQRICAGMEWCGLELDQSLNGTTVNLPAGRAAQISAGHARLHAFVVAVDEETAIARQTVHCLTTENN
jgi:acetate kinase